MMVILSLSTDKLPEYMVNIISTLFFGSSFVNIFFEIFFQTVRTTYWSRKTTLKREDESQDYSHRNESDSNELMLGKSDVNGNFIQSQNVSSADEFSYTEEQSRSNNNNKSLFTRVFKLICGFDKNESAISQVELNKQKLLEKNRRLESFRSLNQPRFERSILNKNLIVIILVAVSFYIFFSIPPEKHIFRHIKLNQTLNNT
jgi:hypothetical protein